MARRRLFPPVAPPTVLCGSWMQPLGRRMGPAILDAYDATNVSNLLYSESRQWRRRCWCRGEIHGAYGRKWKKVYIGGESTFSVFGLNGN